MVKKRKKGFTLIELIAVLVIMAIIALIVTPLVMSIIRKARISADKRSVDAYGRSIELAIAGYLLDTGKFPTDVSKLTIEYSGSQVGCKTTQINPDSSVYLTECTVAGRSVENYTYGSDKTPTYTAYEVGDEISYNNVDYYVIKDSGAKESTVTLLKAEPLTASDITTYSAGTGAQTDGNGGMQYHSGSSAYSTSYVKQVVDAWKSVNAPAATEARLMTYLEVEPREVQEVQPWGTSTYYYVNYDWMYNENYFYWLETPYNNSSSEVWYVGSNGMLTYTTVSNRNNGVVRPVIVIDKSVL